jgi:Histidine kinase-, DNA gyrase B-, and HSP90-like ATPase
MPSQPINVAASIIADVSAGIYRSPAGALKELVSNAFDADASNVHISTGWPGFKTFTCTDDGSGITPEEFQRLMEHIGGSTKRDDSEFSNKKRPLVGRIGIGLLSIAQVCRKFCVISSREGDARKFRADIDLEPYLLAEARRKQLGQTLDAHEGKVRIGQYDLMITDEKREEHYTRVVMERIDKGFRKRLTDVVLTGANIKPKTFTAGTLEHFLEKVEEGTVAEHGAYAQLVWELASTAPVQYLKDGPIRGDHTAAEICRKLVAYNFHVFLDGVELFKPIRVPRKKDSRIEHHVYPLSLRKTLNPQRQLSVSGYLYWQKGRIYPRELQGVLVRVRNVAIGQFDPTYLGYPHHEGWKFSQMMGELYVEEGLDEAVNIDRASFRESDEAYIELQEFLFEQLKGGTDEGAGIFSKIKSETGRIRKAARAKEDARKERFVARLITGHEKPLTVERVSPRVGSSGVTIERTTIVVDNSIVDEVPKSEQQLFLAICGLIEKELATEVSRERRKRIYQKLAELFSEF